MIEEESDEGTSSMGNYSYIYEQSMEQQPKRGKKGKHSKKQLKPITKKMMQEALTEEFIFRIADYFGTSELVSIFRPLSQ